MMRWLFALFLLVMASSAMAAEKRIAFSFDDAPRGAGAFLTADERTGRLIAGLKKSGVRQAAFFVVPGRLGKDGEPGGEHRIRRYVAAGHVIANHSFSHRHLSEMSAEAYLADVDQADRWLRQRHGFRPWFRYPFLDEGKADKSKRDAVRAGLGQRGLRPGHVTVDGNDWHLEALTLEAKAAGQRMDLAALRKLYVETMVGAANFYDGLAVKTWNRSPPHMLLLHENDLAAMFIYDLVRALRKDGWTIVTADKAFADPIYSSAPDVPSANGTLTELSAWEKGLPAPRWYDRNEMPVLKALFDEQVLRGSTE